MNLISLFSLIVLVALVVKPYESEYILTFQPCTCNVSCNNSNNPNDNNNDTITKNLMDMFNTEPVVYTVDLEPIFEVTSIMPSE